MKSLIPVAALALLLAVASPTETRAQQRLPADSMEIGAKYVRWLLNDQTDSLAAAMTPEALAGLGGTEGIESAMDMIAQRAGTEVEVIEEKYITRNGQAQFWHTGRFNVMDEPLQIRWVINREGKITGAGINPLSQAPPTDAEIEP